MGVPEINRFITHLVVERKASASTQNQAISENQRFSASKKDFVR
jgi:hypothetical protein